MFLRFKSLALASALAAILGGATYAQNPAEQKPQKPDAAEQKPPKDEKKAPSANAIKEALKNPTAEQVVESSIYIYGLGGGRAVLNQIRKTALERGKISVTGADGQTQQAIYARWTQRADTLDKEKVRLDQEFPHARYSLVLNEDKIFGVYNDSIFTPRDDATRAFQNQVVHGLEALLRYKENESKLELAGKDKFQGVEFFLIDVTDKAGRKTRFYVSSKTYRIMILDYEDEGVKFRRKFYDYNYAQGTLVPFRTVLWAGDKVVEETEIGTVTFGQKIDESIFSAGQS